MQYNLKLPQSLFFILFFFSILLLSSNSSAKVSDVVRTDHALVSLLSELDEVKSNENFYIGLRFILEKNWHIYWKNPGDSGTTPRVQWQHLKNASVSDFDWPAPQKIILEPLANYGYENEVILPMIVSVTETQGKTLQLRAKVEWLVCKVECIPGHANLELDIPITAANKDSKQAQFIQDYLNKVPQKIHDLKTFFSHDVAQELLTLKINAAPLDIDAILFYPYSSAVIQHALDASFVRNENGSYELNLPLSDMVTEPLSQLDGVVEFKKNDKSTYFEIHPKKESIMPAKKDFIFALLFAFLGGLILNLMPCVFPVISIKVLSLVEMTRSDSKSIRVHGWIYTAGVLFSFLILSGVLILLQTFGKNLGWGFQLQYPSFVFAMILLFYFMALNLYGVFEIDGAFVNVGGSLAQKKGVLGTFFTGVLAVIVATPCTAPFMGAALGITLTVPPLIALLIYMSLGFGLAFPYLTLCHFPFLLKKLPKPGSWMKNLKEFLAFPMILTCIWLFWVLSFQVASDVLVQILTVLVFIFFLFWLQSTWKLRFIKLKPWILILAGVLSLNFIFSKIKYSSAVLSAVGSNSAETVWQRYSSALVEDLLMQKKKIFIDFTAAWCLTCQVNKKLVLTTSEMLTYFKEKDVQLISADWTNQDPAITEALKKIGRNSVPVYLYYDSNGKQNVLPELLTADSIYKVIK